MKIATAAYNMDFLDDWAAYEAKLERWVSGAAGEGADLLVFPEYGAMELATLAGRDVAMDLQGSIRAVSQRVPEADALHAKLAERYEVHILAASAPVETGEGLPVNRARFFAPGGAMATIDKQIMTRFEREEWGVRGGAPLEVFDTALGRIGVLICYDSEFPLLARGLSEAELLLVPSCTEVLAGYWRVRIGSMARALEQQCAVAMSSTVGTCDWSYAVDTNCGAGGVFAPPDRGFPSTGVIAEGKLNAPGWTFAEVDLAAVAEVRRDGVVLNRTHWAEQSGRDGRAPVTLLK
ncbi:carbon-nitrogen hydrolase family protein [Sagittula stellata]|uniref:Hydrolase, carbon-nitrogen family protein n=1 Tax=Sagittula stellata (strain ATCC 700073 / DSM 11524 / E-37) TaxID=388399 RepID=A3K081_SAGS3|nr:carbon-nitrogen hydrolase family protein [Sagittula stellata]EBA09196.1 hydrolase, carbon-nitrogen family protein [Sagittula stellata E-37]